MNISTQIADCPHVNAYEEANSVGEVFLVCLTCGKVLRRVRVIGELQGKI